MFDYRVHSESQPLASVDFFYGRAMSTGPSQANVCLRAFRHDKF